MKNKINPTLLAIRVPLLLLYFYLGGLATTILHHSPHPLRKPLGYLAVRSLSKLELRRL